MNQLIHATSPYLQQHAHNPVDWYPWGPEALDKARTEDKLLIVSIGYAACHWCHVMERESFEKEEVAAVMNKHFVCIKVDREERPDIDQIYMNAVQMISGRGGWPLNAIALPDGRPVFAGTYFRKEHWIAQLRHVANLYQEQREEVLKVAQHLEKGIKKLAYSGMALEEGKDFSAQTLEEMYASIVRQVDLEEGGTRGAPKFSMPVIWQFLLRYHHHAGAEMAWRPVERTLEKMAKGGIYDQVGGGFARYSVDAIWKVPHFEKMLYDNGQLVSLYSEAFQMSRKPLFQQVVYETLDFVLRELTHPDGGFYSSLDADSEGVEGKFYVFTTKELHELLADKAPPIIDYYNATEPGNWEGSNILHITHDAAEVARRHSLSEEALLGMIAKSKSVLLAARGERIRPDLDDKILCSWNALMLKGFVDAYRVFGETRFLDSALRNARFIEKAFVKKEGRLDRNYKNGQSTINAFLEDYSFTIEAFIALYQVTFDAHWLVLAEKLMQYVLDHFHDPETDTFFFTSRLDEVLIARNRELTDNVMPASNSAIAKGLLYLGHLLYNDEYLDLSRRMIGRVAPNLSANGPFMANWGIGLYQHVEPPYQISILGAECLQIKRSFDRHFLPNLLFAGATKESNLLALENKFVSGENLIYICQDKACQAPMRSAVEALDWLAAQP